MDFIKENFAVSLKNWQLDEAWLQQILENAKTKDLLTLDIFDTAITRNVDSPFDVFALVEIELGLNINNAKGFAAARESAEILARRVKWEQEHVGEVNLDDIYTHIFNFIDLSPLDAALAKKIELKIENESLYAVPDILKLTQLLKQQNINFAFVSDMYLPKNILEQILREKGYQGWDNLIVSNSFGKTKSSGDIWTLDYFQDKNILHIGDNPHSDVIKPKDYKIETCLYKRAASELRTGAPLNPSVISFSRLHRLAQIRLRSDPLYFQTSDILQKQMEVLGESLGILMLGSFILWLRERVEKNEVLHIAFCARDGWLMQKVWHLFNEYYPTPNITDSYLYVSRRVLNFAVGFLESAPKKLSQNLIDFFLTCNHENTISQLLKIIRLDNKDVIAVISKYFNNIEEDKIKQSNNAQKLRQFFEENASLVYPFLQEHYDLITQYFKQEGIFSQEKLAIVDMGWNGSMQKNMKHICSSIDSNFEFIGFYYGLWKWAFENRYKAGFMESAFFCEFISDSEFNLCCQGVDTLEELHTPNEGSAVGFIKSENGIISPICSNFEEEAIQFATFNAPFHQSTLAHLEFFLKKSNSINELKDLFSIENALAGYFNVFLSPTDNELEMLTKIKHGSNFDHTLVSISQSPVPSSINELQNTYIEGWKLGFLLSWQKRSDKFDQEIFKQTAKLRNLNLSDRQLRIFERY